MVSIIKDWFNERQRIHAAMLRDILIEIFKRHPDNLVFKGGTAISFFYGSRRFSGDIDFSSTGIENYALIDDSIESFIKNYNYEIINDWEGEILQQQRFRRYHLIFKHGAYDNIATSIDYSVGRCMLEAEKKDLSDGYTALKIDVMSPEEILAEKVRTLYTRKKGRDLYDLHYLAATRKTRISRSVITEKMAEEPELKGKRYSFNSFERAVEEIRPYWNDLDSIVNNFDEMMFDTTSKEVLDAFRNI